MWLKIIVSYNDREWQQLHDIPYLQNYSTDRIILDQII